MTDLVIAKVTGSFAATSAVASVVLAFTDAVTISAITTFGAVLMSGIAAYYGYKANKTAKETKGVAEDTHKAVNSRLDEFMKMAKEKFFADGKMEANREAKIILAAVEKAKLESKAALDVVEKAKPKIIESEGVVKVTSETTTVTKVEPTAEPTKLS